MLTSTIACARPRVVLRAPQTPAHNRYRGLADARSAAEEFCSPAGLHRRPWLERLRVALAEALFVLHCQPIVSLRDGSVSHYEALVRLADEPAGRLVGPNRFLPAAERYGLIRDIDRMVLAKVVALLAAERDRNGPSITMNLSAVSITDLGMLGEIEHQLALAGANPSRL